MKVLGHIPGSIYGKNVSYTVVVFRFSAVGLR